MVSEFVNFWKKILEAHFNLASFKMKYISLSISMGAVDRMFVFAPTIHMLNLFF